MRSILRRLPPLAALLFAVGACQTVSVHSDAALGVDFHAFKTFSQVPPPQNVGSSFPGYSQIAGDHINTSIAHELEMKGFSRVGEGTGDLIVSFSIDGQPRMDINDADGWYGDSYAVNYTQGTLTIDTHDAKKKKLIWHAYGQTDLYGSSESSSHVDAAVKKITKKFPPQPKQ